MNKFLEIKKIHFIGIGGISVGALAEYCLSLGIKVTGSDINKNSIISKLEKLGAIIHIGHSANNLYIENNVLENCNDISLRNLPNLVVYSSAIKEENVELKFANKLNIKTMKRSEFLGLILSQYSCGIAISGSHGKTTTTALISDIFIMANKNPTAMVGGETENFGNLRKGDNNFVIYEACEYKKNFLNFKPNIAIVLNIDNDHLDSYKNLSEQIEVFNEFSNYANVKIVCADDKNSQSIISMSTITFGIKNNANFVAKNIIHKEDGLSFSVYAYNLKMGRITAKLKGIHNIYNLLASIAVANYCKIPFNIIKKAIENFKGVKRRNEFIGNLFNKPVVCDYAHHPTEIDAISKEYLNKKEKILVVFQPHTYSRTEALKEDFVNTLNKFDNLIIYKTYPAREKYNIKGSAKTLYKSLLKSVKNNMQKDFHYANNFLQLNNILSEKAQNIDKIIVLGAGDIYQIMKNLIKK